MSVNSTVASTRVAGTVPRTPVRNSSMWPSVTSGSSQVRGPSAPGSTTSRASGMCSAR